MFTPVEIGVVKKLGAGMTDTFIVSLKEDVHASDRPQAFGSPPESLSAAGWRYFLYATGHYRARTVKHGFDMTAPGLNNGVPAHLL